METIHMKEPYIKSIEISINPQKGNKIRISQKERKILIHKFHFYEICQRIRPDIYLNFK